MPVIQAISIEKEPRSYLEEEQISGIFLPGSVFASASVGILEPGVTQTCHCHKRPQEGIEIIFVYEGTFSLMTEDKVLESFDVRQNGPIYIQVSSGQHAHLKNTGKEQVKFFSVFTPPFEAGEIHFPRRL